MKFLGKVLTKAQQSTIIGGDKDTIYCIDLDPQNGTTVDVVCGTSGELEDLVMDYE